MTPRTKRIIGRILFYWPLVLIGLATLGMIVWLCFDDPTFPLFLMIPLVLGLSMHYGEKLKDDQ